MSFVRRDWLLHGCLKLDEFEDKNRISLRIRDILASDYEERFAVRSWPQQNYRDTLWWYEKSKIPSTVASYFLKIDSKRGPNLYAGVSVEKGIEDHKLAQKKAQAKSESLKRWKLQSDWDWHRFLSCINQSWLLIFDSAKSLNSELYFWIEFDEGKTDSQYYVIRDGNAYWRGGFKPIKQEKIYRFLTKPYPKSWCDVYLAKAFSLNECSPQLEETKILDVFTAMRPIRDLWRGLSSITDKKKGMEKSPGWESLASKFHDKFEETMRSYKGNVLETARIRKIVQKVPEFIGEEQWIYPSDHCNNHTNKGACWCALTKDAIFERISRGKYRVL